jgi:hypothetical protein
MRCFSIPFLKLLLIYFIICLGNVIGYAVNVRDFGAKGDGKTDDTKAIAAAISGASDGLVEFPRGTYRITKTIEIDLSIHWHSWSFWSRSKCRHYHGRRWSRFSFHWFS